MKIFFLSCVAVFFTGNVSAQMVDAGNGHSLILKDDQTVWTVGRNDHGQLGTGNYENKSEAYNTGLVNIRVISRGYDHSMAINESGDLFLWGNNRFGQLGNENLEDVLLPTHYKTNLKFSECEGGYDHSLLLDVEGKVWAMGYNEHGELGNHTLDNSAQLEPVRLESGNQLSNIQKMVTVGSHSLVLDSAGFIFSWGPNYYGELGHFKCKEQTYAAKIDGIDKMVDIAVGWGHSIALNRVGEVFAWGAKPETHNLGDNNTRQFYNEVEQITDLPVITKIACGSWHSLAIDATGKVWTWGSNTYGMLGAGNYERQFKPVQMLGVEKAEHIGGGCFQSMVMDSSGSIYTCGDNGFGQLGIASNARKHKAVLMQLDSANRNKPLWISAVLVLLILIFTGFLMFFRQISKD